MRVRGLLCAGWLLAGAMPAMAQQCTTTGTSQTCTNAGALSGGATGLQDTATVTVTNLAGASVTGTSPGGTGTGVQAGQNVNLSNFGTVAGSGDSAYGVNAFGTANVVNTGAISGVSTSAGNFLGWGIRATTNANVTNSGSIIGSSLNGQAFGIIGFNNATVTNSGTIAALSSSSNLNAAIIAGQTATVTNTGTLISQTGSGTAVGVQGATADLVNAGLMSITGGQGSSNYGVLGNNSRVVNTGTISVVGDLNSTAYGVQATTGTSTVTNLGTVSVRGGNFGWGISSGMQNVVVTNGGTISVSGDTQSMGVFSSTSASVTNSGRIASASVGNGFAYGLATGQTGAVSNTGTIVASTSGAGFGRGIGMSISAAAVVTNSGTIIGTGPTGGTGYGIQGFNTVNLTNAGTIQGSTAALQFTGNADILTLLVGSRLIGAVNLNGGGDTINFRGGNHNLTFDTLAGARVTGTIPVVVSGNRAVAVDPTSFAAGGWALGDFSRMASDAVPVFSGVTGAGAGAGGPLAFAAPGAEDGPRDAFASLPGLSAYAADGLAFKSPTVVHGDGAGIWARGFGGQRIQQQDGVLLRTVTNVYGGLMGGDWLAGPGLRLGAYLGGGVTRSDLDLALGNRNADLVFGGVTARYDLGATFLHAALQGGSSRNTTARSVNNNLLPTGLETATASFNGWYVSPEAKVGRRFALFREAQATLTLTPSLRLRYLYGAFGGYTETGTTAPLTVGGQTVSTLEERGELKLTRSTAFASGDVVAASLTAGVLGTHRVGGTTINAALLGQAIPFATPGQANVWGGFGGAGLDWSTRNVTLFAAGEYLAQSDRSSLVSGRAGLRVAF